MADLRERLIEIARYEIDKGLTGGTDEDVEVAERIVERFFTTLVKEFYIKRRPCTSPTQASAGPADKQGDSQ